MRKIKLSIMILAIMIISCGFGTIQSAESEKNQAFLTTYTNNPALYQMTNLQPDQPNISGPHYGKINVEYMFSIGEITNPEQDQILCLWDWGDGNTSGWVGPYNSGETVEATHAWAEPGNYSIKAKLKDSLGAESNWSEPFYIEIVKLKAAFLFGNYVNKTQTDDLYIVQFVSFIAFPTDQIFYKERTMVISNESFIYYGLRFIYGAGNIAIL